MKNGPVLILTLLLLNSTAWAWEPPESGPGSADYPHRAIQESFHGQGGAAYWLYEPGDPAPEKAPVIIFSHGWGAKDPKGYSAWIKHLVLRGNIVIYPVYQENLRTPVDAFMDNELGALRAAFAELGAGKHVRPDLDRVAAVGHSMGGALTAELTSRAASEGLPKIRAAMCVEPGKSQTRTERTSFKFTDLSRIPAETLLLSVSGDADRVVRDTDAKRIFTESTAVPPKNKNLIIIRSDSSGQPALKANHLAPNAPDGSSGGPIRSRLKNRRSLIDALDYYGYWKLFDGLTDAAFYGKNRNYALGDTPEQRYMGRWPDGRPVKELAVAG